MSKIDKCYNIKDFKELARKTLPSPIFHYIDGLLMMKLLIEEIQKLLMSVILFLGF